MKKFECVKCGECCRHLKDVESLKHLQINGVCKYLSGDICEIYEQRPSVCRYDGAYELFKYKISEDEFYNICVFYCEKYQQIKAQRNDS